MLMARMIRLRQSRPQITPGDSGPIFFIAAGHGFALRSAESIFDFLCRFFAPALECFGIGQVALLNKCFRTFQTINREWLLANIVGDVTEIIVFAMTGEAEGGGDNELRWATGAGAFHGRAEYLKALCQVGAVKFIAFEAVTAGAINQV